MATVRLVNLTKYFDGVVALDHLNLEAEDKEFLVLVGPSGCGKTTALRLIAGLEEPSEGEIHIGERIVNEVSPRDRDIAMVFQNYALYPHMNVYDNLSFGLRLRRHKKPEIERRVRQAAEMLGLEGLLRRRPRELSGGQRQRVAVGRAIVREPQVFLMDEPLSNLDAKLRVQTRAELIKLHRRLGITTIYVTHDQGEAMTMGDRIAVLKDGLLQQLGAPLEVYNHPANLFVAGFIGSPAMNFVPARLERRGDELRIAADSLELPFPRERLREPAGVEVVLGLRPEDIHEARPGLPALQAIVDVLEPMGASVHAYLLIGPHSVTAVLDAGTGAREGAPLPVSFDLTKAHLFDRGTERALT
jgi:multiple sugar transport system ATP-binding protein